MALTPDEKAALQANIATLKGALASGTRQVTLGDQSMTYRSTDDLIKAIDRFENELKNGSIESTTPRPARYNWTSGDRGYN